MNRKVIFAAVLGGLVLASTSAYALFGMGGEPEKIGSVDTKFEWLGPDSKVVVEAFEDPAVAGVVCYVSRAKTGGFKGAIGVAEDTSDASVACRQVGDISIPKPIAANENVFSESSSILFKKVKVVRMVDQKRNVLIYLVYSDKLVDGSPKNAVTAVPVPKSVKITLK